MQTSKTVLEVIHRRGKEGKTLKRFYRQLFNDGIYLKAYAEIYANKGRLTKGVDEVTIDAMSRKRINDIIKRIKSETYRWKPTRRTYIPKTDGRTRPLGIPSGDDKLLQAVIKILLEAYYEPQFSDNSHGFRPDRGCHTALMQINTQHQGTNWFIEGDIKGCFDNIDHEILLDILADKIKDGRFIKLVKFLLKAGYIEDWDWKKTYSGTPQGGIISPLLSNIYLNEFDKWIENVLLPEYNRKPNRRKTNPEYRRYQAKRGRAKKRKDWETFKHYGKLIRTMPVYADDDNYRKLSYIRYADDFLLSFAGTKSEAKEIREKIRDFLKDKLNLELSLEKTLITHAKTQKARFLGYELRVKQGEIKRTGNGRIWFGVPKEIIRDAIKKYQKGGKARERPELMDLSDYDIITQFQMEYRGLVNFYIMANNVHTLSRVRWEAEKSLIRTLAAKHRTTVRKALKQYVGKRNGYRVIKVQVEREGKDPLHTHFGAIPLKRNLFIGIIKDDRNYYRSWVKRSQLVERLLADQCEMCGRIGNIEVHHVKKLKDVSKKGRKNKPAWVHKMVAIRRKTLMTCHKCHNAIHAGTHLKDWDVWKNLLESRVQ